MPRDLITLAHGNGCISVDDFFERPGVVDPPYAYGVVGGDREKSVAFWCTKEAKSDKPYLLIINAANQPNPMGCPPRIEWWNYPGGLSMQVRPVLHLNRFHYATDPNQSAPAASVPNARLIVSEYDGVSTTFVCYKGEWLFSTAD